MPVTAELSPAVSETQKPFTILIMPGHDTDTGGAKYRDLYERDLVVMIANKIADLFKNDPEFRVIVARNHEQWDLVLADYFKNQEQEIIDFKNQKQAEDNLLMSSGEKVVVPDKAFHSSVDKKTAIQLYGVNKWSDENGVDVVLHLHFNDSERPNMNLPGTFQGFTIFIPEKQLINASTSRLVAENIYEELDKILIPEIINNQKDSLIEDQSLIALGAAGTLTKPAMLIEYGYIYEKPLRAEPERDAFIDLLAEYTAAGIKKYVKIIGNK